MQHHGLADSMSKISARVAPTWGETLMKVISLSIGVSIGYFGIQHRTFWLGGKHHIRHYIIYAIKTLKHIFKIHS